MLPMRKPKKRRFVVYRGGITMNGIPEDRLPELVKSGYEVVSEWFPPGTEPPEPKPEQVDQLEPAKVKPGKKSKYEGLQDAPLHTEYTK